MEKNVKASDVAYVANHRDLLHLLLFIKKHGIDINAAHNGTGQTPLTHATSMRMHRAIPVLLDAGVDINSLDGHKRAAVHYAIAHTDIVTLELLIAHGADVNIRDGKGNTPLEYAVAYNPLPGIPFIQFLLAAGANPLDVNKKGKTIAQVAREKGQSEIHDKLQELCGDYIDKSPTSVI